MSLTYHYPHHFSFNISSIWCKIDSPLKLIRSKLKVYLEHIWSIIMGLILTKVRYRLWIPGHCLFCETKWRISDAHGNRLFHFILSFTTSVTNRRYNDSKTFSISIVCNGLFISLCGAYKALVSLIPACYWSGVLDLVA